MARRQNFRRHHYNFAANALKAENRLAELLPVQRIFEGEIQRALRHAHGARRGLNARAFKGLHELFEARAGLSAQKRGFGNVKVVKAQIIFFHAAIAQNTDLTATEPVYRKVIFLSAAWLFGQKHGKPRMALNIGFGAYQQGHEIGARGMGYPCFGAENAVAVIGFLGACRQACEV